MSKTIAQLSWLFVPVIILVAGLVQALLMLIANAVGHGDGSFKKFFALSITVAVVGEGLRSLVLAVIVLLQGANSFDNVSSLQYAVPGLGLLAPGAHGAAGRVSGRDQRVLPVGRGATGVRDDTHGADPAGAGLGNGASILLITAAFAAFGTKDS